MDYEKMYEPEKTLAPRHTETLLLQAGCTGEEVVAYLSDSDQALVGKANLRVKMYQLALNGDERMLKHLGEHHLGQKGKMEINGKLDMSHSLSQTDEEIIQRYLQQKGAKPND